MSERADGTAADVRPVTHQNLPASLSVLDASDSIAPQGGVEDLLAPVPVERDELVHKIIVGASQCIVKWGWEKTSLDDVARAAQCSRASVYRKSEGGKPEVLAAVLEAATDRVLAQLDAALTDCTSLRDCLVIGLSTAAKTFDQDPTLQALIVSDRSSILPIVAFDRLTPLVDKYSAYLVVRLAESTASISDSRSITGWSIRMLIAYVFRAGDARFDLSDEQAVDHLVSTYLLPGFEREPAHYPSDSADERTRPI